MGVVAEGKDDFGVLFACISAELSKRGVAEVVFRQLQPEKDATGQTESGGWTKVVGWLQNHSGPGIETFFSPLFERRGVRSPYHSSRRRYLQGLPHQSWWTTAFRYFCIRDCRITTACVKEMVVCSISARVQYRLRYSSL